MSLSQETWTQLCLKFYENENLMYSQCFGWWAQDLIHATYHWLNWENWLRSGARTPNARPNQVSIFSYRPGPSWQQYYTALNLEFCNFKVYSPTLDEGRGVVTVLRAMVSGSNGVGILLKSARHRESRLNMTTWSQDRTEAEGPLPVRNRARCRFDPCVTVLSGPEFGKPSHVLQ